MNVVLFDDPVIRESLLPFTYTRPVSEIRIGILTIREKWSRWLKTDKISWQTQPYLQEKYPLQPSSDQLLINGALLPDKDLIDVIGNLPKGKALVSGSVLLAARAPAGDLNSSNTLEYFQPFSMVTNTWSIFRDNAAQLKIDFVLLTSGRQSQPITDPHTVVYNPGEVFLEEGVYLRAAVLNAETGPIYLGKNVIVQEGAVIRGSFAAGENSHINMGAKIRGDVTLGPYCKIGGEVSNSVLFGYSNKAHDGYLGNSVLGEWCNLGADTNTSNLKNNYDEIKLWNHAAGKFVKTGLQFCGTMMGDHSKTAINTMLNTATVIDVASNIFGSGFPRNYIPSFAWGGAHGFETYQLSKAIETARRVMARRDLALTDSDIRILTSIFEHTATSRIW